MVLFSALGQSYRTGSSACSFVAEGLLLKGIKNHESNAPAHWKAGLWCVHAIFQIELIGALKTNHLSLSAALLSLIYFIWSILGFSDLLQNPSNAKDIFFLWLKKLFDCFHLFSQQPEFQSRVTYLSRDL